MTVEPLPDPPGTTGAATEQLRSQVLRVWSELLPGAEPRPDADFLRSGGHSLLAVRLVAGLDRATGRRLTVQEVLAARTPAAIARLLAANGKLDKAALPEPEAAPAAPRESGDDPVSGRTELLIAGLWREVLGRPRVRATDNFFEIGGQSLSLAAVQARLADMLSRQIPVVDLFRFPTIRALAAHLDGGAAGGALVDRAAHRGTRRRNRRPAQTARRRTEPGDPR